MGRVARGVRGIRLRDGDRAVSMEVLDPDGDILTVTEKGFGKRTRLEEYRVQGRGGMGIINLKVSKKTGPVIGVRQVTDDNGVMLITQGGKIIRINAADVSSIGRATQGVRVMDLRGSDEDMLVAIAKIDETEEEPAAEESAHTEETQTEETVAVEGSRDSGNGEEE